MSDASRQPRTKLYWRCFPVLERWEARCGPRHKYRLNVRRAETVWIATALYANRRYIASDGLFHTRRQAQDWAADIVGIAHPHHVTQRIKKRPACPDPR